MYVATDGLMTLCYDNCFVLLILGLLSVAECRAAVLARWHDGDDANSVPGTDGGSLVQLLFCIPAGLSLGDCSLFICVHVLCGVIGTCCVALQNTSNSMIWS